MEKITTQQEGFASVLSQVEFLANRRLAALLADQGATVEEWRATKLLIDGLGHPMSEVADAVLLPPATVTRLVDRLVADNYAYRRADEWDRRRILVFMTDRGRKRHRVLAKLAEQHERELTSALDSEAEELFHILSRLLSKL